VAVLAFTVIGLAVVGHVAGRPIYGTSTVLVLAAISVASLGLPALAFSLDIGRGQLHVLLLSGAAAGIVPPVALVASGTIRMLMTGRKQLLSQLFEVGVPLPAYGLLSWPRFGGLMVETCAIGVIAALAVWSANRLRR
jgi:hypothetical protein